MCPCLVFRVVSDLLSIAFAYRTDNPSPILERFREMVACVPLRQPLGEALVSWREYGDGFLHRG